MLRSGEWKYIYMANGGLEQLFNVQDDPTEVRPLVHEMPEVAGLLRKSAISALRRAFSSAERAS
jgi:choline-sulfatase